MPGGARKAQETAIDGRGCLSEIALRQRQPTFARLGSAQEGNRTSKTSATQSRSIHKAPGGEWSWGFFVCCLLQQPAYYLANVRCLP
jgi:hypothetical protein